MAKNKKIVEGEEDEEEEEFYDEEYDIKPAPISTTLPKSDSSLNINKEISINDHPEDLVVGANSPLEINSSTKTDNPEVPLDLDNNNNNNSNSNNNNSSSSNNVISINNDIKKSSDSIKSEIPKSNSIVDIKKSEEQVNNTNNNNNNNNNNSTNITTTITTSTSTNTNTNTNSNLNLNLSSPIQSISPSSIPSSISSQNLNEQVQSPVINVPQRKSSASQQQLQQPIRIPLSLGENKLREYNEALRKSFCARSHNLYFSINREVTNANQHLSSVLDIVKSIQHNIRQSNDDILILSEKLEQTEWSLSI